MASVRCLFLVFICTSIGIGLALIIFGTKALDETLDNLYTDDIEADAPVYFPEESRNQHGSSVKLTREGIDSASKDSITEPLILWWYRFTGEHRLLDCGDVSCFVTNDRHYQEHPQLKVFMFYGTDVALDTLPLPRLPHHEWALLHEESPKNVFELNHKEVMELFNHTSTFKRESHFPLTTQHLDSIESIEDTQYMVPTAEKTRLQQAEGLALVNYVHSDCGTYSDRDHLIKMIQRRIKVDSYGRCLHNKDLPKHLAEPLKGMDKPDFFRIQAKYKFTFATENALCDDYVTEKLWRAFQAGSVPIILGSPKIKELLPTEMSALVVTDFPTVDALIDKMLMLNASDAEYEKYLTFKRPGGVTNPLLKDIMTKRVWGIHNPRDRPNLITAFECGVCKRLHENRKRENAGLPPLVHQARHEHYGCPRPRRFSDSPAGNLTLVDEVRWAWDWVRCGWRSRAMQHLMAHGEELTQESIEITAERLQHAGPPL